MDHRPEVRRHSPRPASTLLGLARSQRSFDFLDHEYHPVVRMHQMAEGVVMRNGIVPEHWTDFYESAQIPAAVRDGGRLHVTRHTGEGSDGIFSAESETQIRQAFRHISATLSKGGDFDTSRSDHRHHGALRRCSVPRPGGSPSRHALTKWFRRRSRDSSGSRTGPARRQTRRPLRSSSMLRRHARCP